MIYKKIYDFCKVKNSGSALTNSNTPTPRVQYLMGLLKSLNIEFRLDSFKSRTVTYHNLILPGDDSIAVSAHHDIVNPDSDNANDNSASVINAIALKLERPNSTVFLLDGEEVGGIGAQRVSTQILNGEFGKIESVLNFELTGVGGHRFFIGESEGKLADQVTSLFNAPKVSVPFNDSVIFRQNGIDSIVINPLPLVKGENCMSRVEYLGEKLDYSILYRCHSIKDSVDRISIGDMQDFVEKVVLKILE
jgi:hypothetical protein